MDDLDLMEFNSPLVQGKTASASSENFLKIGCDILSCGRKSLAYLLDNEISGNESLGILNLDEVNLSFNSKLSVPRVSMPEFNIVEEQKSNDLSNVTLNTAFLYPFSYCRGKQRILSSTSSANSSPFFNSGSLEASEPSRIYSINSSKNYDLASKSEDHLNNAFLQTNSKLKFSATATSSTDSYFEVASKNLYTNLNGSTQHSILPLPELETTFQNEFEISVGPLKNLVAESHPNDVQEINETFNDSVFIEANRLASKIADGSILIGQSFEENLLDCTTPPSFCDIEANETDDVKIDVKTVFKVIDKMLPSQQSSSISNAKKENSNDTLNVHALNGDGVNEDISSLYQSANISSSSKKKGYSEKHSISQGSSNGSAKSRDANELLHNLSEIINHEDIDYKQKIEGQQLLISLANILCSNGSNMFSGKCDNFEDSGHSSIEQDEQQNDQVLDLRVKASKSNENEHVLDFSMASKVETTNKRLSQSFSFPRPTPPPPKLFNGLKTQSSLRSSAFSLESSKGKSNHEPGKLKPKNIKEQTSGTNKGPLKAVIPLGNMSKRKSFSKIQSANVTPSKAEQANSTLFKVKRTSTPIAEPQLKPLAQSTPDDSKPNLDRNKPIACSSQLKKHKFYCPVSPLARPSSIGDTSTNADLNKSSHSGSAPNLSNHSGNSKRNSRGSSSIPSPQPMYRRHSATELKVSSNNLLKLKRSYSIGKDLKTPSVINKMKENARAALSSTKGSNTSLSKVLPTNQKNSILQERNSGITSSIKSFSLLGRLKKSSAGKENIRN